MDNYEFYSRSPAATLKSGGKIGACLSAGSVIALTGELGCGKTLLTRGICAGLGVPPRQVNSPTFQLVNEYRGNLPVMHLDLYRLSGIEDGFEIGIMDYFARAAAGVMIIEWAEKMASLLPEDVLKVEFEILAARQRRIKLSSQDDKFTELFKELRKA
ncbi:MAG: tRNA (adenosine(37)-N6)-threonylcarbamoyltransferase complex ATPase subunit type 1 TsaE [Dehalococcoidales bacterium]|jgi:tRNA threonylcarbamoyladenosine biosynthesis protein TsaE